MYDFTNNEELRNFFNVNPELESSQRFILHNREEVISFETMLNKHVETETHLPFRRFQAMPLDTNSSFSAQTKCFQFQKQM